MSKFSILALATTALMAISAPANAAFVFSGNGGDGSVTGTQTDFTLVGSNAGTGNTATFTQVASFQYGTLVQGSFEYTSFDSDGPFWDPAGYTINGVLFQLSDNAGPATQSGTFSYRVPFGETYGFYVNSLDGIAGPGQIAVSGLTTTAVPEASTWVMLIAGFGLVGAAARRRQAAVAA
jgi:hypothetical protein